jgi:hypothetical protein
MPLHHFLRNLRGLMMLVGVSALVLTPFAWLLRFHRHMWWLIVAGVTAVLVVYSPILSECCRGVRRLRRSSPAAALLATLDGAGLKSVGTLGVDDKR